ncbi:unnamed protein product [Symbiodinium sp. CCMP2592]|nr:unnamed protein product [Symbiodinium sp. CCMP2592]
MLALCPPEPGTYSKAAGAPPLYDQPPPLVELPPENYSDLLTGKVKCWFEDRAFGFITPEGGAEDVFVHKSVLKDGQSLIVDSFVMFDLIYDPDRRRFQATRCFGATLPPDEVSRAPRKGPYSLADPWDELYTTNGAEHLRMSQGFAPAPKAATFVWDAAPGEASAPRAKEATAEMIALGKVSCQAMSVPYKHSQLLSSSVRYQQDEDSAGV